MKQYAVNHYKIHVDMDMCTNLFGEKLEDRDKF